ncbi:MAG TPA: hypothetical protein VH640_12955 [Bryobacteraceae bacterium]|jgi:uncharacterized protein (DUF433 family)
MKEYVEEREGRYYVADSRVSLDSTVYAFRRGESPETIRQNFEVLELVEVYGAITYYLANKAAVDVYLLRMEALAEEERRKAPPLPEGLRERLRRTREEMKASRRL